MTPRVSFLLSVFNKLPSLRDTLDNLRAQAARAGVAHEIVAADDASTDGSLAFLREEATRDPRLVVIAGGGNRGPSVRINEAAAAARGDWLIPYDADDLAPANACAVLLAAAAAHDAPLVFGRARRAIAAPEIAEDAPVEVVDDPLTWCARRQITHMGFLARADVWRAAGGADEGVFIQDQSLPLRLCAAARRAVMIDAIVYLLRPAGETNLSRNVVQQHHDRFLSVHRMLARADLSDPARRALTRQAVSAMWKLRRDAGGAAVLSPAFGLYLGNRLFGVEPSRARLRAFAADLGRFPGVRRASPPNGPA